MRRALKIAAGSTAALLLLAGGYTAWLFFGPNPAPYDGPPLTAQTILPDSQTRLELQFWPAHRYLAEYYIRLNVTAPGGPQVSVDLPLDPGGGRRFNLYRLKGSSYLLANRWGRWSIDARSGVVLEKPEPSPLPKTGFVGSIDTSRGEGWRFIPAAERAELPVEFPGDSGV